MTRFVCIGSDRPTFDPLWLKRGFFGDKEESRVGVNALQPRPYKNTPGRTRACDLRIRNPLSKNDNHKESKDLQQTETSAYKPAYKENPKTGQNEPVELPPDLAEIVAVWPSLPEHIKAAIKALLQTHNKQ